MNKDFARLALVSIGAAVVTTLLTGAVFLNWLKSDPRNLAEFIDIGPPAAGGVATGSPSVVPSDQVIETVRKANPAVVAISISKNVPLYERYFENVPSPFPDFFGGIFSVPRYRQYGTEMQDVGGGSGFIVSEDGYIVTNQHVVGDPSAEYTVFTSDGEKHAAKIVARDPGLELAIIKIDGKGYSHLNFGDSDKIEVGQTVIAIGNALAEFRNTVSLGIVSGLSRSVFATDRKGGGEELSELIQTDAAINLGNSGGPLINLEGEVVGINVAVARGAENIGFALSSNSIKEVVETVKKTGKIPD